MGLKDDIGKIAGLFKSLFSGTRPGLDKFVTKYKGPAFKLLLEIGKDFIGKPLGSWKGIAFSAIKNSEFGAKAPSDTAIDIVTDFAQDMFKAKQEAMAKKAAKGGQ